MLNQYHSLFRLALAIAFVGFLAGCVAPVAEQPELKILNKSGQKLTIKRRLCGTEEYDTVIEQLRPGQNINYLVRQNCVDAIAVNASGKIIATQKKLRLPPAVNWVIY